MTIITNAEKYINTISSIFRDNKYNYVYVSVGSKFIGLDVFINTISMSIASRVDTNALYQMVPEFLINKPETNQILNIVIDLFTDDTDIELNSRLIETRIKPNIDTVIINMDCNKICFYELCSYLLYELLRHNILETNFMICNYIKFSNTPNKRELYTEENVSNTINSCFKAEYKKYNICYYEWYGYRSNLYNFIYNYRYSKTDLLFYKTVTDINDRLNQISRHFDNEHYKQLLNNPKLQGIINNSYDITSSIEVEPITRIASTTIKNIYLI